MKKDKMNPNYYNSRSSISQDSLMISNQWLDYLKMTECECWSHNYAGRVYQLQSILAY